VPWPCSKADLCSLLLPFHRKPIELPKGEAIGLGPVDDGLDDVRSQQGQSEQASHVGGVTPLRGRDLYRPSSVK